MSFTEYESKKEVRFGGNKKFVPDVGKYICEIQDNMEAKFNEKSGKTSLILDFKTVTALSEQDGTNLNISMRLYIADGIQVAKKKLSAIIAFSGQAKYFDEKYEDVPNMDNEKWSEFLKDIKDKLSFRLIGVEVGHRQDGPKTYADLNAFFFPKEQKKVKVSIPEQEELKWEE